MEHSEQKGREGKKNSEVSEEKGRKGMKRSGAQRAERKISGAQ